MDGAEPERFVDYATTGLENGWVHVQPIECWAAIGEVSYSGSGTTNLYFIGIGVSYDCVVGGRQLSKILGRNGLAPIFDTTS